MALLVTSCAGVRVHAISAKSSPSPIFTSLLLDSGNMCFSFYAEYFSLRLPAIGDTAKAKMIRSGGDLALAARSYHVARAVLVGAEKRPATMHFLLLAGFGRIERSVRTLRIARHITRLGQLVVVVGPIPIGSPLPDISGHVIKAVLIRRKLGDRRQAGEAIRARIFVGEMPLKRIGHPLSVWLEFFAPDVGLPSESTACGKFPFRFRWQPFMGPVCVSFGIRIGNLHHRIVSLSCNGAERAGGMAPVCAFHVRPPLKVIIQGHGVIWRCEHHPASVQIFRWRPRKIFLCRSFFCDGDVSRSFNKRGELRIGDVGLIHEKAVYIDSMNGTGVSRSLHSHHVHVRSILRPHRELAAGNPNHPFGCRTGRWLSVWYGGSKRCACTGRSLGASLHGDARKAERTQKKQQDNTKQRCRARNASVVWARWRRGLLAARLVDCASYTSQIAAYPSRGDACHPPRSSWMVFPANTSPHRHEECTARLINIIVKNDRVGHLLPSKRKEGRQRPISRNRTPRPVKQGDLQDASRLSQELANINSEILLQCG